MQITVATLAEQPSLAPRVWSLSRGWPTFMLHDPNADLYYEGVEEAHPEHVLVAFAPQEPETVLARAFTVPFSWAKPLDELPEGGWDWVIRQSCVDRLTGRPPTAVSALEILIRPDLRGTGLSSLLLSEMRKNVARLGFRDLVAPIRPSAKHHFPRMPMTEYVQLTRDDGLPQDPWLRVHVRAGARIIGVAPLSMVVPGTLAQWREWTGLPFDRTGQVLVPEALAPVECDVDHDRAVYVEPNVWVHHQVG